MQIPVIFEHPDFIVVHKPPGIGMHSEEEAGLVVQLQAQWPDKTLFPVHRLDKMTSGLLLLATHKEAAREFQRLFESQQIEKYYVALANHKPKKKQGWIKGDMQPARRGSWKLSQSMDNPAITRFISAAVEPGWRLFLLKPLTGRTHQLRVALKSLGSPICGDKRYAPLEEARHEDRGYLHAYALRFVWQGEEQVFVQLPLSGARFLSPLCQTQLQAWSRPWECF
ncbi:TIGR01621 family pseudouridine synthase [Thiomicrorhabdus cannonii]|uniref:TIGR01621 family pseudouridine synthase n=1 Tax=Thiomicrorhabdus cannonii TaxID=2748011 RepID=UPI0015B8E48C|nr:TIGR01621 family pseudouridine synthase [Thiomicrorhabdus cannonii]